MKPNHKSYWKMIVLSGGFGSTLVCLVFWWVLFSGELATKLGIPPMSTFLWTLPITLLVPAAFCFLVCIGGLLCVYRDITRNGRP